MWARGLKLIENANKEKQGKSRPVWARGLKRTSALHALCPLKSRPVWARGLKLNLRTASALILSRVPCGRVD